MTIYSKEDLEVEEAQLLWEMMNEEDEDLSIYERPDYGQGLLREPLWSEIIEGLWQGGTADHDIDAQLRKPMITKAKFDSVFTMYAFANPVDWFVREYRYGVWDSDMRDFKAEDIFDIVRLAHQDWKSGKKVLIRCQAGWNRSGLITALVLIREGLEPQKAINLIREKRSPHALCNKTFVEFLLKQDPKVWQGNKYGVATRRK